jgi:hypothetical protein
MLMDSGDSELSFDVHIVGVGKECKKLKILTNSNLIFCFANFFGSLKNVT